MTIGVPDMRAANARLSVMPALTPGMFNVRYLDDDFPSGRMVEAAVPLERACTVAVDLGEHCRLPVYLNGELQEGPA